MTSEAFFVHIIFAQNNLQKFKCHSVHDTFPSHRGFAWQEGYGAFSIGVSQVKPTIAYIRSQPEHHRRMTFQDEFRKFLKKHGIEYDERYVWG